MSVHHAFLYQERSPSVVEDSIQMLKERGVVTRLVRGNWGIDESRALTIEAARTDEAGRERLFVIEATAMTTEAQNALLKLFEEPPQGVSFHCFFPPGMMLLATLRSRLSVVGLSGQEPGQGGGDSEIVFSAWYRLPIAEQLSEIEERAKKKDQVWIEAIKQGALSYLAPRFAGLPPLAGNRLYFALTTIGTRGASNKMLLEEVALTLGSVPTLEKTR